MCTVRWWVLGQGSRRGPRCRGARGPGACGTAEGRRAGARQRRAEAVCRVLVEGRGSDPGGGRAAMGGEGWRGEGLEAEKILGEGCEWGDSLLTGRRERGVVLVAMGAM